MANREANREPLRVVAIGGGTGLSALLHGLKPYAKPGRRVLLDITAVVTVTDDGGSSGRLSREFDVLPPGDIRNCMVALSEDEALLSRLFQHRFQAGRGLKGHSFGNLFPDRPHPTSWATSRRPSRPLRKCSRSSGRIYPATVANVALEATLEDGTHVIGETNISRSRTPIRAHPSAAPAGAPPGRYAHRHRGRRPHHARPRLALHQRDP